MVCGLPVVASGVCGFGDHVRAAGAGTVLAEPFAQHALDAVLPIYLDPERKEELGAAGREYCASVDLCGLIARAADVIERRALERPRRDR